MTKEVVRFAAGHPGSFTEGCRSTRGLQGEPDGDSFQAAVRRHEDRDAPKEDSTPVPRQSKLHLKEELT